MKLKQPAIKSLPQKRNVQDLRDSLLNYQTFKEELILILMFP
jgi:hypothetical protein